MPLILALGRQRQMDVFEFEVSVVYREFPEQQGYTEKPCLRKNKK